MNTVAPDLAGTFSVFGTDGIDLYFGSGVADDSSNHAPDLWRLVPGEEKPRLVWRNPGRERSVVVFAGDIRTIAFVEMDDSGARDWNLWLLPDGADDPILLDSHPGAEDVSGFVPSVSVSEGTVVWTAFDLGPSGPVSQLLLASGPDWTPEVLEERPAAEAELWLPQVHGLEVVYTELRYNAARTRDERHVYLTDVARRAPPRQLDESGRATMPIFVNDGVVWKETDPGFNMFNWGKLVFWHRYTDEIRPIPSRRQPDLNYPTAGSRFIAVHGYDSSVFEVYDVDRMRWRLIDRYDIDAGEVVVRPVASGPFLIWAEADPDVSDDILLLRWAYLPAPGEDRLLDD